MISNISIIIINIIIIKLKRKFYIHSSKLNVSIGGHASKGRAVNQGQMEKIVADNYVRGGDALWIAIGMISSVLLIRTGGAARGVLNTIAIFKIL